MLETPLRAHWHARTKFPLASSAGTVESETDEQYGSAHDQHWWASTLSEMIVCRDDAYELL
jgi:hypothetical protein